MAKKHSFAMVPKAQMPRSAFDRSFTHKTTFDEGLLIPVFCQEILPGDSVNMKLSAVVRLLSPLQVPMMDDLLCDFQFFFVPNRLVWEHWQAFNGEQKNPGDSTDYVVPTLRFPDDLSASPGKAFTLLPFAGSIFDYFGIPMVQNVFGSIPSTSTVPNVAFSNASSFKDLQINALPFRAYNLIWNEWYRDENLQDRVAQIVDDGPDNIDTGENLFSSGGSSEGGELLRPLYYLLPRGKRHDYFTACLPWPQKGPGVEVSIGEVYGSGTGLALTDGSKINGLNHNTWYNSYTLYSAIGPGLPVGTYSAYGSSMGADVVVGIPTKEQANEAGLEDVGLVTTPITINDLRQAFQLQRLYERDARGGTRYVEILRSHFGVVSPDARLQRPEYLGGFSQPLSAVNVAQTSATSDDYALGDLSSYVVSAFGKHGFVKSFVEHGFIIGLCSVRARLTYWQGLNRMWSRKTRFDYYWPALAHLGEQAVLNKEIFLQSSNVLDSATNEQMNDSVFGYQERWSEYRYAPNVLSGLMRPYSVSASSGASSSSGDVGSGANYVNNYPIWRSVQNPEKSPFGTLTYHSTASLQWWNLSQVLGSYSDDEVVPPALNQNFITEQPPVERVVSVPSQHHFIADFHFSMKHVRVMPTYSVPGLIDHF